jgi:hypothetical protein
MHECSDYDIGTNRIDTTPEGSQVRAWPARHSAEADPPANQGTSGQVAGRG